MTMHIYQCNFDAREGKVIFVELKGSRWRWDEPSGLGLLHPQGIGCFGSALMAGWGKWIEILCFLGKNMSLLALGMGSGQGRPILKP